MGPYLYNMILFLPVAIFSIIFYIYLNFKQSYAHWSRKNVKYLTPTFPFGNISDFIFQRKGIGIMFYDMYKELKSRKLQYAGFYAFATPNFMPLEPELTNTILTKKFAHFQERDHYIDEDNDPLTLHLGALRGMKWKNLRTKLTTYFTPAKIKMMYQYFVESSNQLTKVVTEKAIKSESIDIKDFVGRYTSDVISAYAFDIHGNALNNPEAKLRKYGQKIPKVFYRLFFIRLLSTTHTGIVKLLNLKQFGDDISNFFTNWAEDIVKYRENNNVDKKDMLNTLIKLKNQQSFDDDNIFPEKNFSGEGISMKELAAQIFLFYFNGFEMAACTMTFCLYELAYNQDIQDKLRMELIETLKKYNNELTYEAVLEMNYLDKVIKETLRKYPVSPFLNRRCVKEFKIPNTDIVIEKNVSVVISILGLHMDPDYYHDPEYFDPERFNEDQKHLRHPYTYLPFGAGPRMCMGMRFGLLQTKVGIASLIMNLKFTLDSKNNYPAVYDKKCFFLDTRDTIFLRVTEL